MKYKWKRGCGYDLHARDEIERCKLLNLYNSEFQPNSHSEADASKDGQIQPHIRPGPDMKIWPDFGRGRGQIWYPVQP